MRRRKQTDKILSPQAQKFYHTAIGYLLDAGVPFLVGGAYALRQYTGIALGSLFSVIIAVAIGLAPVNGLMA